VCEDVGSKDRESADDLGILDSAISGEPVPTFKTCFACLDSSISLPKFQKTKNK